MPKRKRGQKRKPVFLRLAFKRETKDAAKEYRKNPGAKAFGFINCKIEEKRKGRKNSSDKSMNRTVFSEAKAEIIPGEKKIPSFLQG